MTMSQVEILLAGFPVIVEQAVVWGDMDSYRHVNNTVYFRYFENARLEYGSSQKICNTTPEEQPP
jgi:acyl-CoA thioester hydrolase